MEFDLFEWVMKDDPLRTDDQWRDVMNRILPSFPYLSHLLCLVPEHIADEYVKAHFRTPQWNDTKGDVSKNAGHYSEEWNKVKFPDWDTSGVGVSDKRE